MTAAQQQDASELAAPLDQLLIEATGSPLKGFIPDASTAKFVGKLLSQPGDTARQLGGLAGQLLNVARGQSDLAPARGDRRFTDPAWTQNPMLHRLVQAYLAAGHTADELLDQADLGWRDNRRVRFLVQNLAEALSPSNVPLVNPASAKEAIDTGGASLVRGARNLVNDMRESPRVPEMVDGSGFEVGRNVGVTPGAVVFRSEVLELIQYRPQTEKVRTVPLLVVPPTINKFYVVDLAPGRSIMEHLVQSGQQAFIISWRNPGAQHADWGLDTYVDAVIEALGAVERITGSDRTLLTGICSGGIIASVASAVLAGTEQLDRLAGFTLLVTVLDNTRVGDIGALQTRQLAQAATAVSRERGYLDGRTLAELFAWLRPGDLIWNYWVNNYLLGRRPPAFDVLFWNSDTTRMAAQLHADFVNLAMENQLVEPGALKIGAVPIDLSNVDVDSYIVAGIADHITPWQNCYRSTALLGGDSRFVLSRSGHIAALVNPPGNPKATFQLNPANADDPADWLAGATTTEGSWWTDWVSWLTKRGGRQKAAPKVLGGGGLESIADAPGTYVHEK